jgi:formate dehydrogenase iron-sulfur subunit
MSKSVEKKLTRRVFLKTACLSAGSGLLLSGVQRAAASEVVQGDTVGMLIDLTRCVGCNSCALACREVNELGDPNEVPDELAPDAYTFVESMEVMTPAGETVTRYVKRQCMHCLNAACVAACPAAAMYSSGEGPIVYRAIRCLGCRYCEVGCPFQIPRFDWDASVTAKINKCWMCYERLQEGEEPACVVACPTGALRFGKRAELISAARRRIETHPELYIDHIMGENEVGGTSVLYLSDVPFDRLGFPPSLPEYAPPEQTEKVMSALPVVIGSVATLMAGTAFFTHREPHSEKEA